MTKPNHDLFQSKLGRLFAYSPIGTDDIMPHEIVREMIEKYGDVHLEYSYISTIMRCVYIATSGETEHKYALSYKKIADKFRIRWSKTAEIYDNLAKSYENDSIQDRQRAEEQRW